ncbi:DUF1573 domain-containing protein [Natranaerofaba carboxydovora]|uniref:DUF1573 domain-containing protein n=1 Tax=Natranaerofaba carboxydovora TaxID=2742683 RepID=UPI001F12D394|nr:DUF1573 domain-containing protein [Natranaerofaba carboxydovora]UMZ75365.1 hypothetical protein ACONDI_02988 [Natranaerofaba carboxydovora]
MERRFDMGENANCHDFQQKVSELLIRHKSILDNLTKFQESNSKVNRAIVKSITTCGCLEVKAKKQDLPGEVSIKDLQDFMDTHLAGKICENCKEVVVNEIGTHLFYLAALANTLDLDLNEVIEEEMNKLSLLGYYNLT